METTYRVVLIKRDGTEEQVLRTRKETRATEYRDNLRWMISRNKFNHGFDVVVQTVVTR